MPEDKRKTISLKTFQPENYRFWVSQVSATLACNNCLDIVLGNEPDPTPNDVANINAALRRTIESWKARHALAREALLNAVDQSVLIKIHQLPTANDIWVRLADEYGTLSNIKYSKAESELRSLL